MKRLDGAIMTFIILAVVSFFILKGAFWPCVCSAVVLSILKKAIPELLDELKRKGKL